jgi:hypothetical protein
MTEGRCGRLGESRAECAGAVGGRSRIAVHLHLAGRGEMTQLVINRSLLRREQQQQQAECK